MKKIYMVSSEVSPFAKTGGLGDVLGSLPEAIAKLGNDVRVVMPKYGLIAPEYVEQMEFLFFIYVPVGWRNKYCGVFELQKNGVTYYFIDNEYYFGDPHIYKWNDLERFSFFARAAVQILQNLKWRPDIIHCHDWQAGAIPVLLDAHYRKDMFYSGIKTIFTIHNLAYQGIYDIDTVKDFLSLKDSYFTNDKLEFHGGANLLKAGLVYSDYITTVSPTYSEEIKSEAYDEGLEGLLRARANSLCGIINGINYDEYSPKTDKLIFENYDSRNFAAGKRNNKLFLQEELGLEVNPDIPMFGIVSRLVGQKGFGLLGEILPALSQMDIQLVILGTGDEQIENMFRHEAWCNPSKISANITFNNTLAHKIYASCDMFLMPSLFEPCGLSQMISLSYGTIPIVRETGGLADTIQPYNEFDDIGNGFTFAAANSADMMFTIKRALEFYKNKTAWKSLVRRGMKENFSWDNSAKSYEEIYEKIL
ncbi:MAG: glycogen synthase GlgA [Oscillospiraceae bacterium]|nr:glycogen synthase GlgA [Oscillospiraceae bacterium]